MFDIRAAAADEEGDILLNKLYSFVSPTRNVLIIILIAIVIITGYIIIFSQNNNPPQVKTIVELRNVSSEEYETNTQLQQVSLSELKKIFVEINITNSKKCKKREITIPDLNIIDLGETRVLSGGDSEINNLLKEDAARAEKYVIFNSAGLSFTDLKEMYKDKVISVNIVTSNDQEINYHYDIGELLK